MAGPLYRSAREVMDSVPPYADCDLMAAESMLTLFRTPCGQTYLHSTSATEQEQTIRLVAAIIGVSTETVRRNEAAQQWQSERAAAKLEAARWVLEFVATNRHLAPSAWPPEVMRKLQDILVAIGGQVQRQ